MREGQADTGVGQKQRSHLAARQRLAHEQHADQQCQRRVGEQDQALETSRDVLQSKEIEDAGTVVAEQTQRHQHRPVVAGQRRRRTAGDEAHPEKHRQRKHHAQRQQGDRIDRCGRVGQLDENRLERETERRQYCQGNPQAFSRPVLPGHGPPYCRRGRSAGSSSAVTSPFMPIASAAKAPACSLSWKARAVPMPCAVMPVAKPRIAGSLIRRASNR